MHVNAPLTARFARKTTFKLARFARSLCSLTLLSTTNCPLSSQRPLFSRLPDALYSLPSPHFMSFNQSPSYRSPDGKLYVPAPFLASCSKFPSYLCPCAERNEALG